MISEQFYVKQALCDFLQSVFLDNPWNTVFFFGCVEDHGLFVFFLVGMHYILTLILYVQHKKVANFFQEKIGIFPCSSLLW